MLPERIRRQEAERKVPAPVPVRPRGRERGFCGVCPACLAMAAVPAAPAERIAELLGNVPAVARGNRACVAAFLNDRYGMAFANRVLGRLPGMTGEAGGEPGGTILRKAAGEAAADLRGGPVSPGTDAGRPIERGTRSRMESLLGRPFGHVRIHDGAAAARSARALNAKAYALGRDIVFAAGEYNPRTAAGSALLAHELAHVVQSREAGSGAPPLRRLPVSVSAGGDPLERQADAAAASVAAGRRHVFPSVESVPRRGILYRKPAGEEDKERPGWIAEKIAGIAANVPGFTLVTVLVGKNPITGSAVERTPKRILEGITGLVPGGAALFRNLDESGAIDSAFAWVSERIKGLSLTWESVKELFGNALGRMHWYYTPWKNLGILKEAFAALFERVKTFAVEAGRKILYFVFEGALRLVGLDPAKILGIFRKAGEALDLVVKDPVRFLRNLLAALAKGFGQFSSNIREHLKAGLLGWLFGALEGAGIEIPKSLDLKSIVGLFLQVMGITKAFLRRKVARVIGEKNLELIGKAWGMVSTLIGSGIAGLWEMIKEHVGNLKDMVLGAIQDWVVTRIVTAAVTKLVSMFNPVGAIVTAIQTIYNTVMFFVERIKQILELVDAIVSSFLSIAQGAIDRAANWVEKAMARTLPVIIGFLARLLGLGGIGEKIRAAITKFQEKVEKAVDKALDRIVAKARGLIAKALPGKKKEEKKVEEKPMSPEMQKRFDAGMAEIDALQKRAEKDPVGEEEIGKELGAIRTRYGFRQLKADRKGDEWVVDIVMNPRERQRIKATPKDEGDVGHYSSLPAARGKFERHHIPQSALMKFVVRKITTFKEKIWTRLQGWTHGKGMAIVMSRDRHLKTRTWGGSGKERVDEIKETTDIGSTKKAHGSVVKILKDEIKKDTKDVRGIYSGAGELKKRIEQGLKDLKDRNDAEYLGAGSA